MVVGDGIAAGGCCCGCEHGSGSGCGCVGPVAERVLALASVLLPEP